MRLTPEQATQRLQPQRRAPSSGGDSLREDEGVIEIDPVSLEVYED